MSKSTQQAYLQNAPPLNRSQLIHPFSANSINPASPDLVATCLTHPNHSHDTPVRWLLINYTESHRHRANTKLKRSFNQTCIHLFHCNPSFSPTTSRHCDKILPRPSSYHKLTSIQLSYTISSPLSISQMNCSKNAVWGTICSTDLHIVTEHNTITHM